MSGCQCHNCADTFPRDHFSSGKESVDCTLVKTEVADDPETRCPSYVSESRKEQYDHSLENKFDINLVKTEAHFSPSDDEVKIIKIVKEEPTEKEIQSKLNQFPKDITESHELESQQFQSERERLNYCKPNQKVRGRGGRLGRGNRSRATRGRKRRNGAKPAYKGFFADVVFTKDHHKPKTLPAPNSSIIANNASGVRIDSVYYTDPKKKSSDNVEAVESSNAKLNSTSYSNVFSLTPSSQSVGPVPGTHKPTVLSSSLALGVNMESAVQNMTNLFHLQPQPIMGGMSTNGIPLGNSAMPIAFSMAQSSVPTINHNSPTIISQSPSIPQLLNHNLGLNQMYPNQIVNFSNGMASANLSSVPIIPHVPGQKMPVLVGNQLMHMDVVLPMGAPLGVGNSFPNTLNLLPNIINPLPACPVSGIATLSQVGPASVTTLSVSTLVTTTNSDVSTGKTKMIYSPAYQETPKPTAKSSRLHGSRIETPEKLRTRGALKGTNEEVNDLRSSGNIEPVSANSEMPQITQHEIQVSKPLVVCTMQSGNMEQMLQRQSNHSSKGLQKRSDKMFNKVDDDKPVQCNEKYNSTKSSECSVGTQGIESSRIHASFLNTDEVKVSKKVDRKELKRPRGRQKRYYKVKRQTVRQLMMKGMSTNVTNNTSSASSVAFAKNIPVISAQSQKNLLGTGVPPNPIYVGPQQLRQPHASFIQQPSFCFPNGAQFNDVAGMVLLSPTDQVNPLRGTFLGSSPQLSTLIGGQNSWIQSIQSCPLPTMVAGPVSLPASISNSNLIFSNPISAPTSVSIPSQFPFLLNSSLPLATQPFNHAHNLNILCSQELTGTASAACDNNQSGVASSDVRDSLKNKKSCTEAKISTKRREPEKTSSSLRSTTSQQPPTSTYLNKRVQQLLNKCKRIRPKYRKGNSMPNEISRMVSETVNSRKIKANLAVTDKPANLFGTNLPESLCVEPTLRNKIWKMSETQYKPVPLLPFKKSTIQSSVSVEACDSTSSGHKSEMPTNTSLTITSVSSLTTSHDLEKTDSGKNGTQFDCNTSLSVLPDVSVSQNSKTKSLRSLRSKATFTTMSSSINSITQLSSMSSSAICKASSTSPFPSKAMMSGIKPISTLSSLYDPATGLLCNINPQNDVIKSKSTLSSLYDPTTGLLSKDSESEHYHLNAMNPQIDSTTKDLGTLATPANLQGPVLFGPLSEKDVVSIMADFSGLNKFGLCVNKDSGCTTISSSCETSKHLLAKQTSTPVPPSSTHLSHSQSKCSSSVVLCSASGISTPSLEANSKHSSATSSILSVPWTSNATAITAISCDSLPLDELSTLASKLPRKEIHASSSIQTTDASIADAPQGESNILHKANELLPFKSSEKPLLKPVLSTSKTLCSHPITIMMPKNSFTSAQIQGTYTITSSSQAFSLSSIVNTVSTPRITERLSTQAHHGSCKYSPSDVKRVTHHANVPGTWPLKHLAPKINLEPSNVKTSSCIPVKCGAVAAGEHTDQCGPLQVLKQRYTYKNKINLSDSCNNKMAFEFEAQKREKRCKGKQNLMPKSHEQHPGLDKLIYAGDQADLHAALRPCNVVITKLKLSEVSSSAVIKCLPESKDKSIEVNMPNISIIPPGKSVHKQPLNTAKSSPLEKDLLLKNKDIGRNKKRNDNKRETSFRLAKRVFKRRRMNVFHTLACKTTAHLNQNARKRCRAKDVLSLPSNLAVSQHKDKEKCSHSQPSRSFEREANKNETINENHFLYHTEFEKKADKELCVTKSDLGSKQTIERYDIVAKGEEHGPSNRPSQQRSANTVYDVKNSGSHSKHESSTEISCNKMNTKRKFGVKTIELEDGNKHAVKVKSSKMVLNIASQDQLENQNDGPEIEEQKNIQISEKNQMASVQNKEAKPGGRPDVDSCPELYYSSESDSDLLPDASDSNDMTPSQRQKLMLRQHREVTMFLVKHAGKFTSSDDTDEHFCNVCRKYKTNGLFKLSNHLKKHITTALRCQICKYEAFNYNDLKNHEMICTFTSSG
ncbi:hypothetical protein PoB_003894200 [Plakobranchus ocellatus]|uniref:Uncharacterized protein n=1 Tax=Plakobranchus ocellatus TaxID=259542 RepID=A0AAV4AZX6_9GAST|nr:hypothetical protein PoB_003894200 [Plakobranchus ocellatus]